MEADDLRFIKTTQRIMDRVERKFDNGQNHFAARGALSSIALAFTASDGVEAIHHANERIIEFLKDRNAEGVVYAVREDLGNGFQDSTDYVNIHMRNGEQTGRSLEELSNRMGRLIVVRAYTPNAIM